MWIKYRALGLTLLTALIAGMAVPVAVAAQVVSGVVRDRINEVPIQGVFVSQVRADEILATTITDASGRFELSLREGGPFELRFERMGYSPYSRFTQQTTSSPGALEVTLAPDPYLLSGIDVRVERERERFRLSTRFLWTEDGLYLTDQLGAVARPGCLVMVLDSVVIRDPDLYRPEVIEEYWPASHFMDTGWGPRASFNTVGWGRVELGGRGNTEPRLEREAAPCGAGIFIPGQDPAYRGALQGRRTPEPYPKRPPPDLDAPIFELVPRAEATLADGGGVEQTLAEIPMAVEPDGTLVVAAATGASLRRLDTDGRELERWELGEPPSSLEAVTHLGWSDDTLWAADASLGRVVFLSSGDEVLQVREATTPQLVPGDVEGAPYDGDDPDLRIPFPAAEGRWLSVQLARSEPYPLRLEGEPARRALVVLDSEERLERVLEFLRPGPWRIDVHESGGPVDPFRDHPLYALSPDGTHVTVVERSLERAVWMDVYTVTRFSVEGDTLFRVERPPPLIRLSNETLRKAAEELSEHPVLAEALPWPDVRPTLVEGLIYRSPWHPPISEVIIGWDGTTWLRWPDARDGSVRWDVLDSQGRALRTLVLDRGVRIRGATADTAWALVADPEGMRAVRFEIKRAECHESHCGVQRSPSLWK